MPEQEQPQDEIIEEEEAKPDNLAAWVTAGAFLGMVIVGVWGAITLKPYIENWLADQATPDLEDEVLVCEQPEVEEFCSGFADFAVSVALAQAPDSCPLVEPAPACRAPWKPHEDHEPEAVHNYLIFADQLIADMESAASVIESMSAIMEQFGAGESARQQAFRDKSWLTLLDDMDRRVDQVRRDLWDTWTPGPFSSDNPLLDAHARLYMAYSALDRARDYVWLGIRDDRPLFTTGFTEGPIRNMRIQIDSAQQFGLRAMR